MDSVAELASVAIRYLSDSERFAFIALDGATFVGGVLAIMQRLY